LVTRLDGTFGGRAKGGLSIGRFPKRMEGKNKSGAFPNIAFRGVNQGLEGKPGKIDLLN